MIPVVVPSSARCHCGRGNWQRRAGDGGTLVICADCGYAAAASWDDPKVPSLHKVTLMICDLCLTGAGGLCHSPGCAFWLKSAPDVPLCLMPELED